MKLWGLTLLSASLLNMMMPTGTADAARDTAVRSYAGTRSGATGTGHFNGISGNKVIINDAVYTLSPNAAFQSPYNTRDPEFVFRNGDIVGYRVNSRAEVTEIWFIGPRGGGSTR